MESNGSTKKPDRLGAQGAPSPRVRATSRGKSRSGTAEGSKEPSSGPDRTKQTWTSPSTLAKPSAPSAAPAVAKAKKEGANADVSADSATGTTASPVERQKPTKNKARSSQPSNTGSSARKKQKKRGGSGGNGNGGAGSLNPSQSAGAFAKSADLGHRRSTDFGLDTDSHPSEMWAEPADDENDLDGLPPSILDAIVKIYTTHVDPNYSLPWQMKRQNQSTSSGFVISGRLLLTNAHSVEHHTVVKVKKRGSDTKYMARVLTIGVECDLALLTVEDEAFWEGDLQPLLPGPSPKLQSSVVVIGFPVGGDNISVTAGVVSRIEIQQYSHGASELLGVQIDAAINSGNSGGPALNSKFEVVGIAFQSLKTGDSELIGYLIPWLVVEHFLEDYRRNGRYTGFCVCGFSWQRLENPQIREWMKMTKNMSGVRVKRVDRTTPAAAVLQRDDIIMAFDGVPVSNSGTVPFRTGERILFHFLVSRKFVGDSCTLTILRDGVVSDVSFRLVASSEPLLVRVHEPRGMPEYFTIAGLVFVALSEPYLRSEYGERFEFEAPVKLLDKLMHESKQTPNAQVVVLSQVLNAEINVGYEYLTNTQVLRFNGHEVENLQTLAALVENTKDEYLRFDLEYNECIVLHRDRAVEASRAILTTHCIPSAKSIGSEDSTAEDGAGRDAGSGVAPMALPAAGASVGADALAEHEIADVSGEAARDAEPPAAVPAANPRRAGPRTGPGTESGGKHARALAALQWRQKQSQIRAARGRARQETSREACCVATGGRFRRRATRSRIDSPSHTLWHIHPPAKPPSR
ncbi:Protease Do-like 9 [Porphyridium purpureum]|uniref:Protease Do-like 9 n=1 Tax=Porphyridium purpureum TaxID=35688 RepID=A0A5J4YHI1_PORPP|nr:Protease Do-like 9 [Porphyridium purpureum]|eukprot:POR3555..scf271_22